MEAEITFDTILSKKHNQHVHGCYRLPGKDWQVFYFTSWYAGQLWEGDMKVIRDQVWGKGITGIEVRCKEKLKINKSFIKNTLAGILLVAVWSEVPGPNSLTLM